MIIKNRFFKGVAAFIAVAALFTACKKDDKAGPSLRVSVDASAFTATTLYSGSFLNANGKTTVDFSNGNLRLKMFQALNSYLNLNRTQIISADVAGKLFSNNNNPFTAAIHPDFALLNGSKLSLRNSTAISLDAVAAEVIRKRIEDDISATANISPAFGISAAKGIAGMLGTYIVDTKGIEKAQIVQKGLIGAFQLDYINNFLLNKGLDANNSVEVSDKGYTQLEQNWDEAYGLLTLNPVFLAGSTDAVRGTSEFGLGSYVWEYNKPNYAKINLAFLKGRAAAVNNNKAEMQVQAKFIRTQFETTIANAALGYLVKWNTSTTEAARAHAIGEGLGFIYSLRFCALNGADAKFSDDILTALISSSNGFWDLTPAKIETASASIKARFKIQ